MEVSVIIPTLNEADNIEALVDHLFTNGSAETLEVIVVDGGSRDNTAALARKAGAQVFGSPKRGRAVQMNYGAKKARGKILYFVHADTRPPATYLKDIREALGLNYPVGCFRFRFDSNRLLLKLNSWFTRFDLLWCRGGDQSMFVLAEVFDQIGGFCQRHLIMEEYDFIIRVRKRYPFRIIPKSVLVSARKYQTNSYLRVQLANFIAYNMYRLGFSQERIYNTYRLMLDYR